MQFNRNVEDKQDKFLGLSQLASESSALKSREIGIMIFTDYIKGAMRQATYEILTEDNGTSYFYGEIPACQGLLAIGYTLEECRDELQASLEDWILLGLLKHDPMPIIDGIELVMHESPDEKLDTEATVKKAAVA